MTEHLDIFVVPPIDYGTIYVPAPEWLLYDPPADDPLRMAAQEEAWMDGGQLLPGPPELISVPEESGDLLILKYPSWRYLTPGQAP